MRFDHGMASGKQDFTGSDIFFPILDVASDAITYCCESLFAPPSLFVLVTLMQLEGK